MNSQQGRMQTRWRTLAVGVVALAIAGCMSKLGGFVSGYAEGRSAALDAYERSALTDVQGGAVAFALSDFGALNTDTLRTHAIPWRFAATALVLRDVDANGGDISRARLRPIMQRFGFLYPDTIGNWPQDLPPPEFLLDAPQGLSMGVVRRSIPRVELMAANLSCASCHGGNMFDADGGPTPERTWLGAPNASLDLELYVNEVYAAVKHARSDQTRWFDAVRTLFPDTSRTEFDTMRNFVMPRLNARMSEIEAKGGRPLPFKNGAPGLTNGVAALRMQLGVRDEQAFERARGFTSIPDLGARGFRSALLYDSAYAPRGEARDRAIQASAIDRAHLHKLADVTAFFTVPSMGVHPDRAAGYLHETRDIFAFLNTYAAPRFPRRLDTSLAANGRGVYAARCASCHGVYDANVEAPRLLSFPNWIGPFDTDPVRAEAFDAATANAVNASRHGRRFILARSTGAYTAPLLTGLWMSAPYLHNGSVPTLWHLMNPDERPVRFQVGGHALDYRLLGVAGEMTPNGDYLYRPGYTPWSQPTLIDTRERGLSNHGHDAPFTDMSEPEKRALLEYLKLL